MEEEIIEEKKCALCSFFSRFSTDAKVRIVFGVVGLVLFILLISILLRESPVEEEEKNDVR